MRMLSILRFAQYEVDRLNKEIARFEHARKELINTFKKMEEVQTKVENELVHAKAVRKYMEELLHAGHQR